jgi:PadR family transcriptional regulator, regulatory protein AphA
MSNRLTSLSYVVLAMVGRDGASAYDLVQMTESGQALYWAGAASKIYAEPKRLEQLGYLDSELRAGKRRKRPFYTLTDQGLRALQEWLGLPSPFPRVQSEAAIRIFASDLAPDDRVLTSLLAMRGEIAELSAEIDAAEQRASAIPHRQAQLAVMRSLGRRLLQAHLDWIDEAEAELGADGQRRTDRQAVGKARSRSRHP